MRCTGPNAGRPPSLVEEAAKKPHIEHGPRVHSVPSLDGGLNYQTKTELPVDRQTDQAADLLG